MQLSVTVVARLTELVTNGETVQLTNYITFNSTTLTNVTSVEAVDIPLPDPPAPTVKMYAG